MNTNISNEYLLSDIVGPITHQIVQTNNHTWYVLGTTIFKIKLSLLN